MTVGGKHVDFRRWSQVRSPEFKTVYFHDGFDYLPLYLVMQDAIGSK